MIKKRYSLNLNELIFVINQFYRFAPKKMRLTYQDSNELSSVTVSGSCLVNDIKITNHSIRFCHKSGMLEFQFKDDKNQVSLCEITYLEQKDKNSEWWIKSKGLTLIFSISRSELISLLNDHHRIMKKKINPKECYLNQLFEEICTQDKNVINEKETDVETVLSYLIEISQIYKKSEQCLKSWIENQYILNHDDNETIAVSSHNLITDFHCLDKFKPSVIVLKEVQTLKVDVLFILYYWQELSDYKQLSSQIKNLLYLEGCAYIFTFGEDHFAELDHLLKNFDPRLRLLSYERYNQTLKKSLATKFKNIKIDHFHQGLVIDELNVLSDYIKKNLDPLSLEILKKENSFSCLIVYLNHWMTQNNGCKLTIHLICLTCGLRTEK